MSVMAVLTTWVNMGMVRVNADKRLGHSQFPPRSQDPGHDRQAWLKKTFPRSQTMVPWLELSRFSQDHGERRIDHVLYGHGCRHMNADPGLACHTGTMVPRHENVTQFFPRPLGCVFGWVFFPSPGDSFACTKLLLTVPRMLFCMGKWSLSFRSMKNDVQRCKRVYKCFECPREKSSLKSFLAGYNI